MERIAFTPELEVGHPDIDRQHREIFDVVDHLFAAADAGRGGEEVASALAFLEDYVREHIGLEDEVMERTGYPELVEHRWEHAAFVAGLRALEEEHRAGGATPELTAHLASHLGQWLREHILGRDQKLALFLRTRGLPPA